MIPNPTGRPISETICVDERSHPSKSGVATKQTLFTMRAYSRRMNRLNNWPEDHHCEKGCPRSGCANLPCSNVVAGFKEANDQVNASYPPNGFHIGFPEQLGSNN